MSRDLAGRTVVVTGASSGTGAEAARLFAARGAEVVVLGRSPRRTRAVAEEVGGTAHLADFAVLADVRRVAEELREAHPVVHVLADNAGGAFPSTEPTADGHEPNYQVNALAPMLLVALLTPALRAGRGRVVSTSSRSHKGATLEAGNVGEQLDNPLGLGPHQRYARAKLAALLLHRAYASRHPDVPVADFHPGIVASDFGRYLGAVGAVAKVLGRPFLASPRTAAHRLVHLATTADPVAGRYFAHTTPAAPNALVLDADLAEAVWSDADARLDRALERA
ncbi:SDR family NAD(P)-dependent oxidoreductase [Umezawaea tangerina]|uniref:Short subunit dehydrogenase n=1 Tax=Umezawaea tangerina TaxID=84725 RepID=A0A2T0SXJ4_9PSEU|nr:SDR family NAD(P)-dependent oxidoreductase [Umezawaea tangerina]PRY38138.1 short subunit dehydrogenase [Umezawaea tangerina]